MRTRWTRSLPLFLAAATTVCAANRPIGTLRAGAAAAEIEADDSMALQGGIGPRYVKGQEAPLRATALVIQEDITIAIVSVDVVEYPRDVGDAAAHEIAAQLGIPAANVLIAATHTHSAPAMSNVHGVKREEVFRQRARQAVVNAVRAARNRLRPAELFFALGEESSVGQNSRLLLSDGTIFWVGNRDDAVRPTGPFDPQLPVLAFRDLDGKLISILFNHSTHNIGSRTNKRSPAFYGLVAQELETDLGGTNLFVPGAEGSTHALSLSTDERVLRIKNAVKAAVSKAEKRNVETLRSVKEEFPFKVRVFDEQKEDDAVSSYVRKRSPGNPERTIGIFRTMRQELAPHQGETRKTWLHVLQIGDIAFVGVPGEMFTALGLEIKRRSPFRYTYVIAQANDAIGYLPDPHAFELGGYQTWMGAHSFSERGTGGALVDEAVRILNILAPSCQGSATVPSKRGSKGGS